MISHSMDRLLRITASTKRATHSLSTGKRGTPVAYLTTVMCMPLDPIGASETRQRMQVMGLNTPILLLQTVVSGEHDIEKGDVLTVSSVDYEIKDLEDWAAETGDSGQQYLRLIVEKVKP
jgi:hypothetical protein